MPTAQNIIMRGEAESVKMTDLVLRSGHPLEDNLRCFDALTSK